MNVLFVSYNSVLSNSGIHILSLANSLKKLGLNCAVCVPETNEPDIGKSNDVPIINYTEGIDYCKDNNINLIHVWTPREITRIFVNELLSNYSCPYIIHFEDNEEAIFYTSMGIDFNKYVKLYNSGSTRKVPSNLTNPIHFKEFISLASGFTILIDSLREFCPEDAKILRFWPGYDESIEWDKQPSPYIRNRFNITDDEFVLLYNGNVHYANRDEVKSLYLSIALLNRNGYPTRLIRTGNNYCELFGTDSWNIIKNYVTELGFVDRKELADLFSITNAFVQPGKPNKFNDYRFPSKIPEFLASGKPVILPNTNIGKELSDGEECLLLQEGNAIDIKEKLLLLFNDNDLSTKIGASGKKFAEKYLRWGDVAQNVYKFYQQFC